MSTSLRSRSAGAVNILYSVCCVLFFLALVYNHFQLITFETPLDYNEAGMLTLTDTVAAGQDPYSLESQPIRTSIYPALYNRVVASVSGIFGNNLVLHRAVTGVFLLATCLLCFTMAYRESHSFRNSFAAGCIFYAGLLYYSTPIAGPTGIGLFLFLSSIVLPWLFNFSNRSLCLAIVLGILAFYAKQYFVASLGFIALYLFLAVSKSKGLIFGACSLILFLGILLYVHVTSPYFLDNTVFAQGYAAGLASSNSSLVKQYLEYGWVYLPVFLILGASLLSMWLGRRDAQGTDGMSGPVRCIRNSFNLKDLRAPLLKSGINYVWYCFFCSLIVITLSLGKSAANHLSYFFQLLSPFLLAGTVSLASRFQKAQWLFQLVMIAAFYKTYAILQHDFSINSDNWEKIRLEISAADDIFASPVVLAEIMQSGKVFYENGHTRYVVLADNKPAFLAQARVDETPGGIWAKHVRHIRQKLEAQEFDLILLDQWMGMPEELSGGQNSKDLLEKYYYRSGVINLSLAKRPGGGNYRIQVWKPLHDSVQNSESRQ